MRTIAALLAFATFVNAYVKLRRGEERIDKRGRESYAPYTPRIALKHGFDSQPAHCFVMIFSGTHLEAIGMSLHCELSQDAEAVDRRRFEPLAGA
jgi:ribose 1,5-bisphosphokinase PhnN